jgi:hypothetical protein
MTASVHLKKIAGRESQGVCRQDELIGGKPASRKVTVTLTNFIFCMRFTPLAVSRPYSA